MASYLDVAASGTDLEVAQLQRRGLPPRAVERVAKLFAVPKSRILEVTGISPSTYNRHVRMKKNLPLDATQALTRLVRLHAIARRVLPKPEKWFQETTPLLGNTSPLEAGSTEAGGRAVESLLHRIEYGSAA